MTESPRPPLDSTVKKKPVWEPPRILWEQTFMALAQVTEPPCVPGSDPHCTFGPFGPGGPGP